MVGSTCIVFGLSVLQLYQSRIEICSFQRFQEGEGGITAFFLPFTAQLILNPSLSLLSPPRELRALLRVPLWYIRWWSFKRSSHQSWARPTEAPSLFILIPAQRMLFCGRNVKCWFGSKCLRWGLLSPSSWCFCILSWGEGSAWLSSRALCSALPWEHSPTKPPLSAKQLTWLSLLINLSHWDFCKGSWCYDHTCVTELPVGSGTWPFPFLPAGCKVGKWSLFSNLCQLFISII